MKLKSVPEDFDRWPELASLDRRLDDSGEPPVAVYRETLAAGRRRLRERFEAGEPVADLVHDLAHLVDGLLLRAWRHALGDWLGKLSLVAVGGYGRGELHPCSDIDVLILCTKTTRDPPWKEAVSDFVTLLWDLGLEVGQSVRSVSDSVKEARSDITVATSLMESRLLHGDADLFDRLRDATSADKIWPSREFFTAKYAEQVARHQRYHDTAYNLEPNLKGSPGGLRDMQMVGWVAKRHFNRSTLGELVAHDFLSAHEYAALIEGRNFLWRIRFALHLLTGRREDRSLFDYQATLAEQFGYRDLPHTLAVEQFMQSYYRTVIRISRLNEMLLQLFSEAILTPNAKALPLDDQFQEINSHVDAIDDHLFENRPQALLEIFLVIQERPHLQGVTARTLRLIRRARRLIDDRFREDPENHAIFRRIMRAKEGVTHELRRMNRYGILGRYIPAFGMIVGRMQYDLFHAYTVDAHTLFVVSNLRRFALSRFDHEHPYCSQIMQALPKPELAYLAGLFHDIAKGRGGDHSELGARDAEAFCLQHGLRRYDARLVAWLVRHHLDLSTVAQKKDINDPEVVNDFAMLVGDRTHLDYLYVLTVADVRGTNPKLFNSWKASLFEKLYRSTRKALDRGLENPIERAELIVENRSEAERLIEQANIDASKRDTLWKQLGESYFLRHSAKEIAWHTELLLEALEADQRLVAVAPSRSIGHTTVLWYAPQEQDGFARATAVFGQLGLSVLDARVTRTANGYSLDTYRVMETTPQPREEERLERIREALDQCLHGPDGVIEVTRQPSRRLRLFSTPTEIEFLTDLANRTTVMELTTADRPGLLSTIGSGLYRVQAELQTAKITTIGERAEDVFYLTGQDGRPLSDQQCGQLQEFLLAELDAQDKSA